MPVSHLPYFAPFHTYLFTPRHHKLFAAWLDCPTPYRQTLLSILPILHLLNPVAEIADCRDFHALCFSCFHFQSFDPTYYRCYLPGCVVGRIATLFLPRFSPAQSSEQLLPPPHQPIPRFSPEECNLILPHHRWWNNNILRRSSKCKKPQSDLYEVGGTYKSRIFWRGIFRMTETPIQRIRVIHTSDGPSFTALASFRSDYCCARLCPLLQGKRYSFLLRGEYIGHRNRSTVDYSRATVPTALSK